MATLANILPIADHETRLYRSSWQPRGDINYQEPPLVHVFIRKDNTKLLVLDGTVFTPTSVDNVATDWCIFDFWGNRWESDGMVLNGHGKTYRTFPGLFPTNIKETINWPMPHNTTYPEATVYPLKTTGGNSSPR